MDVAVLGAAGSGPEIAQVCAVAGHEVTLYDPDATAAMDAVDAIEGRLPADEAGAVDRIAATTAFEAAVSGAAVVVEAATADATDLQRRLAQVEELADRSALLAVSVPGVSVTAAAAGLKHPDRAMGLTFRRPLDAPLVEVVVADQTTRETCDRARSFVEGIDRTPVVVRDAPGLVSTRAALALEAEAMRLIEEEVAGVAAVDDALELGYGHPVGPLARADRAGLDDRLDVLERLHAELGDRFAPPDILRELVAAGRTGAPSGEGFYVWEDGDPVEPAIDPPEIPHRRSGPDDPVNG